MFRDSLEQRYKLLDSPSPVPPARNVILIVEQLFTRKRVRPLLSPASPLLLSAPSSATKRNN